MSQEKTLYDKDGVRITSRVAVIGATTYRLANITGAELLLTPANRSVGYSRLGSSAFLAVIGLFIGVVFFMMILSAGVSPAVLICPAVFFATALLGFMQGGADLKNARDTYTILIVATGFKSRAITSPDRDAIIGILDALNDVLGRPT